MAGRQRYFRRAGTQVVAVRLDLDTAGCSYRKWGGNQTCKPGDWIVNNGSDVYTVDSETFGRTYRAESLGVYRKVAPVWAEVADSDGEIRTREGVTHYKAGDYIVFNDEEGQDGYAMTAALFEATYEPAD